MKNIAIVGAGAMGCLFAARLVEAGVHVCLIDIDRPRLDALSSKGITLSDDRGERTVPVRAVLASEESGPFDLLILLTKGMHSAVAMRSVAHLRENCWALSLQNGIGNAELIADVFAPSRVLMGVTDFPADLQGMTSVASHGPGHIWLGALLPEGNAGVPAVADLFRGAGMAAEAHESVLVPIWEKVAFNSALNALATVTGLTVGEMDVPAGHRIIDGVLDEVVATAKALSIAVDRSRIASKVNSALEHHRSHRPSMLQDRIAGRITEIESINGAVAKFARTAGVPVPVTATLADLVRITEPRK